MTDRKVTSVAEAAFMKFLKEKGLRCTGERIAMLRCVLATSGHFTAEDIFAALATGDSHVSRATVYNNLSLMAEAGIVKAHRFGNNPTQYERIMEQSSHLHLFCTQCGKVKEVRETSLFQALSEHRFSAFTPAYFDVYVHGLCSRCARIQKKMNALHNKQ